MGIWGRNTAWAAAWLLALSGHALGASHTLNIGPASLTDALSALAQSENIEILFDQSLTAGKRSVALRGELSPEQALDRLLAGSGLSYRLSADGAYIVAVATPTQPAPKARYAELPIEEILVVGHRTQNADIKRSPDDIQPYQVMDASVIDEAQFGSPDSFLKAYLPANMQSASQIQAPSFDVAAVNSQIDLRGLGPSQTMVLIDGRRLPSFPRPGLFSQPDINGLPLALVERVETLGVSAGGIFGIGAAGGSINFVMKRDFEGTKVRFDTGLSSRGDAWQTRVQGATGFSIAETGTDIMIAGGFSKNNGLHFGDRDIVQQARRLRYQKSTTLIETDASPSLNFNSTDGSPLSVGGVSLNSPTTFLPLSASGALAGSTSLLAAKAGKYDLTLSPDGQGALQSLITPMQTKSALATVRQRVGDDLEFYLDLMWLEDSGHASIAAADTVRNILEPGDLGNPFDQEVTATFPTPGLTGQGQSWSVVQRGTLGAIYRLGGGWSADIDVAIGQARNSIKNFTYSADTFAAFNPLVGGTSAGAPPVPLFQQISGANRLYDYSLRLGGPLWDLDGGPLTLKAVTEVVQEINPGLQFSELGKQLNGSIGNHFNRQIQSAYVEARAPLVSKDSDMFWLRGLELQLAVRADRYTEATQISHLADTIPGSALSTVVHGYGAAKGQFVSGTFGARIMPVSGLTLRASIATGYTPPTSDQLQQNWFGATFDQLIDPKRGGAQPLTDEQFLYAQGGSDTLKPQRTISYTAGLIWEPEAIAGLRLSLDYSELQTNDEIASFANGDFQYILNNEARYPGRVVRAPLLPADAALGYTAGQVVSIDSSLLQIGRSVIRAIDLGLGYATPTPWGVFSLGGQATWEPSFRRWADPAKPAYELVGHMDGPLRWKGNLRLGWADGPWSSGLDLQMYSGYSATFGQPLTPVQTLGIDPNAVDADGDKVPAQFYLDWTLALHRTETLPGMEPMAVEYRFGIGNLLDTHVPIISSTAEIPGHISGQSPTSRDPLGDYSPYGDVVGRRFELSVSLGL